MNQQEQKRIKSILTLPYFKSFLVSIAALMIFYIIGCQMVSFYGELSCDEGNGTCTSINVPGFSVNEGGALSIKSIVGTVDILFVVDNSVSMREELKSIGDQFADFLDSINKLDYRIAIITTDWINDRGNFITFDNGQPFLKSSDNHSQNSSYFKNTIQNIPPTSIDDERGIFVLNQALNNNNNNGFFRPHSLFLVIIVSDEDERSTGGKPPEGQYYTEKVLPLEDDDKPSSFFQKVSNKHQFSVTTAHSIIVTPGDEDCRRTSQGFYGDIYQELSHPSDDLLSQYSNIVKGKVLSICDTNYSSQLGSIAHYLLDNIFIPLHCPSSDDSIVGTSVVVEVDNVQVHFRLEGKKVKIIDKVSLGSIARVYYSCQK